MRNYIKIDRKILEWEWWEDINTFRLFVYMLLKANWKEGSFKGMKIPRGSLVSSISKLSEATNLTVDEVRTALKHLKCTKEITSKSHSKFTVFTVNNYDLYQDVPEQETKQIPSYSHPVPNNRRKKEGNKLNIYQQVVDIYNDICVSFPKVTKISESRKKAISARLKTYGIEDFKKVFTLAEESRFLKGGNDKNWSANFDWLIRDANMAKVLDGNYQDTKSRRPKNAKPIMERGYDAELEKQVMKAQQRRFKQMKEDMERGGRDERTDL